MAFTNIPPNLQDIFYSITDRIAKLETGPNQPMDYAQSAQSTAQSAQNTSAQAITAANLANTQATTAIALANTKNTVFYSGTAPTANAVNDQWINTAQGNKLYIWNGSAWVSVQDTAIAAAQSAASSAQATAALANTQATTAITLAGTKNTVFYSGSAPTANAVNDQWINTAQGNKLYIWNGSSWISVQDNAIATAQSAATAAQTTADGKNKIYRQGTTPTGSFSVGDIWFNTASDNAISRWDGSSWVATTLGNNALVSISANKITAGTIDASVITVSNINAGNISTGYLAAARIATGSLDASVITAGTITASQIATGTITATQIAAGTITATEIASATITGSKLVAGTITATQIATGTITASQIATNTITATQIAAGTITATEISSSYVYAGTINASQINAGTLTGFTIQTSSGSTAVKMVGSTNSLDFINGGSTVGRIIPWASNGVYISYSTGSYPATYVGSSTATLAGSSTIDIFSSSTGNGYDGTFTGYGDFNITSSYELRNPYSYNNTTTNAATVWVSSTGQYRRSTASSQQYKTDITNLADIPELNPQALYNLPVRAFRYKDEYISKFDDRAGALIPGFIAEEVDAIYPIAADYVEGVETWNERMIIPGLLALIQDQEKRIKQLEGK